MNNFWDLLSYEYKKIFIRKSTWIALLLFVFIIIFNCFGTIIGNEYENGVPVRSKYDSMNMDREYERALVGKEINADLIMEASRAYQKIPVEKSLQYTITPEYQKYARPYYPVYGLIRPIYNKTVVANFGYQELQTITFDIANSFYDYRSVKIKDTTENYPVSNKVKERILALDQRVKKPFVIEYFGGYDRFVVLMYTTGLICAFMLAFIIAPIFSGEYHGVDQLILSTKNGKKSLIRAKLLTGVSISISVIVIGTLLTYIPCMIVYGFDGANAALQLKVPLSTLPLTMGQLGIICFVCVSFACVLIGTITMVLSAKLQSSFIVITISGALIIIPLFIKCSYNNLLLYKLYLLIPTNMMEYMNMIQPLGYGVFGYLIPPYIYMPMIALFVSAILMPFAYKVFENHQVE